MNHEVDLSILGIPDMMEKIQPQPPTKRPQEIIFITRRDGMKGQPQEQKK